MISLFNLSIMKMINTGDRMFDSTMQMLLTTIVGGLVTGLITLYTKGLWKDTYNKLRGIISKNSYNPLEFDPSLAPEKPLNGVCYLYRYCIKKPKSFYSWFYINHGSKLYTQKLKESLNFPDLKTGENIMNLNMVSPIIVENTKFDIFFPIWRHSNGIYVFVKSDISADMNFYYIYSDCGDALKSWAEHFHAHYNQMEKVTDTDDTNNRLVNRLYKVISPGDYERVADISTNRIFDNMFFEEKRNIIPVLTAFRDGTLYPKHLPLDNKLGIILHGPPGTGKTGFISALANFLKRDIMMVNMSRIQTRSDLDSLLSGDAKRWIYVFEEFDCMPGVTNRLQEKKEVAEVNNTNTDSTQGLAYAMMLMAQKEKSDAMMDNYRREKQLVQDKLDIGYILSKLDGLESADGRIIVATTNYPERIDSALLRPGRFGIQLKLGNCTRSMMVDILGMAYQLVDKEDVRESLKNVEEYKISPAELLQLVITKKSVDDVVKHILAN